MSNNSNSQASTTGPSCERRPQAPHGTATVHSSQANTTAQALSSGSEAPTGGPTLLSSRERGLSNVDHVISAVGSHIPNLERPSPESSESGQNTPDSVALPHAPAGPNPSISTAVPTPAPPSNVINERERSIPPDLPATPRTATSFGHDASIIVRDVGVQPFLSSTPSDRPRPPSLASTYDGAAYVVHVWEGEDSDMPVVPNSLFQPSISIAQLGSVTSGVPAASSESISDAQHGPPTVVHHLFVDRSTFEALRRRSSLGGRASVADNRQDHGIGIPNIGQAPEVPQEAITRQGLLVTPTTQQHPAVLTPDTPESHASSGSTQYATPRDSLAPYDPPALTLSDPFQDQHFNTLGRLSSDANFPPSRFSEYSGYPFPLESGASETDDEETPNLSEDHPDDPSRDEDTDQSLDDDMNTPVDQHHIIIPSTPPRHHSRGHGLSDPTTSPSQRVEQRVMELGLSHISGKDTGKDKGRDKGVFGLFRNRKGKEREKEKAGLVEKFGHLSTSNSGPLKDRLLPPMGSWATKLTRSSSTGPSPSAGTERHQFNIPPMPAPRSAISTPRPPAAAIRPDAQFSRTLQPTPTSLSRANLTQKLCSSRSDAHLARRFDRSQAEPTIDYNLLTQPEFWRNTPFLASFLTPPGGRRTATIRGCDGSPPGHSDSNGVKTCACPTSTKVIVEDSYPSEAQQNLRLRLFVDALVAYIRSSASTPPTNLEGAPGASGGNYF